MTRGVVACSDPRASAAGGAALRAGGNAADAAVAAALVACVVEPHYAGPGGDGFFIWVPGPDQPPVGLDGSGAFPVALTVDALAAAGADGPPARGAGSATVPGALALFCDAVHRFGRLSFADVLAPALTVARQGFRVRRTLAVACSRARAELAADPVLGPLYAPDGRALVVDQPVRNPALADLLHTVARDGVDVLYGGAVGAAVAARVRAAGGYLDLADLRAHRTLRTTPQSTSFRDRLVFQMPAPTQGPAVLGALRRLDAGAPVSREEPDWAPVVDAVVAGMADAGFDLRRLGVPGSPVAARGDTTYLAAADEFGAAASLITSVFGDFGAQFGVPELGAPLGNRAAMLRLLHQPPVPGGKPPHTTIPAAVTRPGAPPLVLGVAGGFMQAQAQVQLLVQLVDRGLPAQRAVDEPRFRVLFGGDLAVEEGHPLAGRWPEAVGRPTGPEGYGAAQLAGWVDDDLVGAADPRRGGAVEVV